MNTMEDCHVYTEGFSEHRRDIIIYVGDIMSTSSGYNGSCGRANG